MKKILLLLVFGLFCALGWGQRGVVTGTITDAETGEGLAGANVILEGTVVGTLSDENGSYRLNISGTGERAIIFSYVGYATQSKTVELDASGEMKMDIALEPTSVGGQEVVVSASRKAEKLTNAPATISVINAKAIAELPSFNVAELLGRQRGVDYVRSGVLGIGVNARGFNSAFNAKNLQINDSRLSTLIATGLPLGALSTTVKEDVERIEVILGPSSALYGPNAHNGLLNTITKDPRTSQGTTVAIGAGNQSVISGRLRHAMKLNDKWAFKVAGEYTQGEEFDYTDTVYIGVVGYPEYQLDRKFNSLRGEAAVYYSPTSKSDIILAYGGSKSNNIGNTNAGRNQIKDWTINWVQARYVSPHIFAQVYHTWSKSDSTYAMNQRTVNYWSFKNAGFSEEESSRRSFGEQWFAPLGIPLKRGALFQDDSRRLNAEIQYNNKVNWFSYIVGAQYQGDIAGSHGTYLLDNGGEIKINQFGGYLQMEGKFGTHLKAIIAARADNHDLYGFNFIPKAGLVYFNDKGAWRLTYGKGIAAPTILNLEANIFGGLLLGNGKGFTVKEVDVTTQSVVGSYKVEPLKVEQIQTVELGYKGQIGDKLFLDANAYYNISEDFLSPAVDASPDRDFFDHDDNPATAAIPRIKGYTVLRGDQPMSEITATTTLPDGDKGADLALTYLNFGKVNTYGFDASISYSIMEGLTANLNYSYFGYDLNKSDLKNDGNRDKKVDENDLPINTPAHKIGVGLNYSHKKLFATVFGRWVQEYDFFSGINVAAADNPNLIYGGSPVVVGKRVGRSFNYGPLGGFFNLDIGVGYEITNWLTVSGQVVNVLNAEVREFVGSPYIKPLYSIELKFNLPAIGGGK